MSTALFAFLQLDLAGSMGIADGRYLVREAAGATPGGRDAAVGEGGHSPVAVLVVETRDRRARPRRRLLRRERPVPAEHGEPPQGVPMTRLTVIRSEQLGGREEALAWLERAAGDDSRRDEFMSAGLAVVNRALHAQRTAAQDPSLPDDPAAGALAIRVGYGTGNDLVAGDWIEARELPHPEPRRRRADALRPQERLAAVLGGRDPVDACELLLLRARADLDAGRVREAALQMSVGLDALLVELGPGSGQPADGDQQRDLATLAERRAMAGAGAGAALEDRLAEGQLAELERTLALCERVLRRRRVLAP